METIKLDTKLISSKILFSGKTKQIELNKYYDLDGMIIDDGTDIINYENETQFEIIEKKIKYDWGYGSQEIIDCWEIKVNGKKIYKDIELTAYKVLKNKLVLSGCSGAG